MFIILRTYIQCILYIVYKLIIKNIYTDLFSYPKEGITLV